MSDSTPMVFFSWQSDTDARCNRSLLRRVLTEVCKTLAESPDVEDSPRMDSGMDGTSGSPEVASVMFQKIDAAAVFVGDMTLVGTIDCADGRSKRVPNPNVLTEMGYGAARLGWSRVINVMNEHYGVRDEIPFDVRNRRYPITYTMAPDEKSATAEKALAGELRVALRTVFSEQLRTAQDALARLDHECVDIFERNGDQATWWPSCIAKGFSVAMSPENFAITRLLELRLAVYRDSSEVAGHAWSYEWTYLGRQTIALWRETSKGNRR